MFITKDALNLLLFSQKQMCVGKKMFKKIIADNEWCYKQVCLRQTFKFTKNVTGKLAYSTCYSQYGLSSTKL